MNIKIVFVFILTLIEQNPCNTKSLPEISKDRPGEYAPRNPAESLATSTRLREGFLKLEGAEHISPERWEISDDFSGGYQPKQSTEQLSSEQHIAERPPRSRGPYINHWKEHPSIAPEVFGPRGLSINFLRNHSPLPFNKKRFRRQYPSNPVLPTGLQSTGPILNPPRLQSTAPIPIPPYGPVPLELQVTLVRPWGDYPSPRFIEPTPVYIVMPRGTPRNYQQAYPPIAPQGQEPLGPWREYQPPKTNEQEPPGKYIPQYLTGPRGTPTPKNPWKEYPSTPAQGFRKYYQLQSDAQKPSGNSMPPETATTSTNFWEKNPKITTEEEGSLVNRKNPVFTVPSQSNQRAPLSESPSESRNIAESSLGGHSFTSTDSREQYSNTASEEEGNLQYRKNPVFVFSSQSGSKLVRRSINVSSLREPETTPSGSWEKYSSVPPNERVPLEPYGKPIFVYVSESDGQALRAQHLLEGLLEPRNGADSSSGGPAGSWEKYPNVPSGDQPPLESGRKPVFVYVSQSDGQALRAQHILESLLEPANGAASSLKGAGTTSTGSWEKYPHVPPNEQPPLKPRRKPVFIYLPESDEQALRAQHILESLLDTHGIPTNPWREYPPTPLCEQVPSELRREYQQREISATSWKNNPPSTPREEAPSGYRRTSKNSWEEYPPLPPNEPPRQYTPERPSEPRAKAPPEPYISEQPCGPHILAERHPSFPPPFQQGPSEFKSSSISGKLSPVSEPGRIGSLRETTSFPPRIRNPPNPQITSRTTWEDYLLPSPLYAQRDYRRPPLRERRKYLPPQQTPLVRREYHGNGYKLGHPGSSRRYLSLPPIEGAPPGQYTIQVLNHSPEERQKFFGIEKRLFNHLTF